VKKAKKLNYLISWLFLLIDELKSETFTIPKELKKRAVGSANFAELDFSPVYNV